MRKATKVLLLVSEIFAFVSILGYAISAIIVIASGSAMIIAAEGEEELIAAGVVYIVLGIFLFAPAGVSLATGLVTDKTRRAYTAGGVKADFKKRSIAMIVLGALSCELPIVPAIFMLVQNENCFHD